VEGGGDFGHRDGSFRFIRKWVFAKRAASTPVPRRVHQFVRIGKG
jgi:hypothetical protein